MELLSTELVLLDADETSAHYGPAMGALEDDAAPVVLLVPLDRLGGAAPESVTVTITTD